jgi:formyltetrahydrofolate-dependent phosphoribosylglycinamide formyltransferase
MYKLAIFVSGRGSNLLSIAQKIKNGTLNAEIAVVVSNNKDCKALEFSTNENIPTYVVDEKYNDGIFITYANLKEYFIENNISLIVLAGFLKKIPVELIKEFKNRIINIHPALLPAFGGKGMYGINVHKAVFNSSVKVSGATVHFVDEIYDNGKIIGQEAIDISDVDAPEEIAQRVLIVEHKLLPNIIKKFTENKIRITENRVFID